MTIRERIAHFMAPEQQDKIEEFDDEESIAEEYDPVVLLLIGELAVVILLGAGWRMSKLSRVVSNEE